MNNCLVSVITPAYNAEKTILKCYKSLYEQSFKDFEWIIINDNSNDQTEAIVTELMQKNGWIVYIKNDINKGAAFARNKGIEIAKGRYIAFLDADDTWNDNKLAIQVDFMQKTQSAFSCANYEVLRNKKPPFVFRPKRDIISYRNLLKSCSIGCLTVMYDSLRLGKVYMPLDAEKREDHAMWLDITKSGVNCYRIDENLATYYIGESGVSYNKRRMFKYQYRMFKNHLNFSFVKSLLYTIIVSFNKIFRKYK